MALSRIFVSPPTIRENLANGQNEPTIVVKQGPSTQLYHRVSIHGPSSVVYDPTGKHGASVFITTTSPVQGFHDET